MKKILFVSFLIVSLMFTSMIPCTVFAAESQSDEPGRVINMVYDDSASMYRKYARDRKETDKPLDTWSKAKYSLEVFVAMMNPKDVMNIYLMTDYKKPTLTLYGNDDVAGNVKKVDNMPATAGDTPFQAVKKAYKDLAAEKVEGNDEKWLVILTDGAMEKSPGNYEKLKVINSFFKNAPKDDIKVMFMAMGPEAKGIKGKPDINIFSEESKQTGDILNAMTESSTRVFNRNKLEVSNGQFKFDIPMKELVVFAQSKSGNDVKINSIKSDKKEYTAVSDTKVTHADTETARKQLKSSKYASSLDELVTDKNLSGYLSVFRDDEGFDEGTYTIDAENADIIEVYYKPDIAVAASLTDEKGKKVKSSGIKNGNYTIHFDLVKEGTEGTDEPVKVKEDSSLLGDVSYHAVINNNGEESIIDGQDQQIQIKDEGSLSIQAIADYLKYNHVYTTLDFNSFTDRVLTFEEVKNPTYRLTKKGFNTNEEGAIKLALKIDGQDPTDAQWSELSTLPTAELIKDSRFVSFKLKKGDKTGEYELTPEVPKRRIKKLRNTNLDGHKYIVSLEHKAGSGGKWKTSKDGDKFELKVDDKRNIWDKWGDLILKIGGVLLLLLLILSETLFKARFKRSMQKEPKVSHIPDDYSAEKNVTRGKFDIAFLSRIVPFQAERGTLSFKGGPSFSLKAIRGTSNMRLVNARAFVKKDNIKFDGQRITEEEARKFTINPSTKIVVTKGDWKHECIPSQPYTVKK